MVALALTPADAGASGSSVARFGGEHGHPTTTNATALYYNPAALTGADGAHLYFDLSLIGRHVSYEHRAEPSDMDVDVAGANTGQNQLLNFIPSPMAGVTARYGNLAGGVGVFTPFGGGAQWDKNESFQDHERYPGPYDGVQRWFLISGELRSTYVTTALAYEIEPLRTSVGVSGNAIVSSLHGSRARTPQGDNDLEAEGRGVIDVSGLDWSVGIGVMVEAVPEQLWIGASYQSRPSLGGPQTLEGELTTFLGGTRNEPEQVEHHTALPDVIRLGARYRPSPEVELRLSGDYQRWSALEAECTVKKGERCDIDATSGQAGSAVLLYQPRDWHDTWGVRAGGSYWPAPTVEISAGAEFLSNAVPDATLEPTAPDFDGFAATLGARLAVTEAVHAHLSYSQLLFVPRDTQGKSTLDDHPAGVTRNPDSGGRYEQIIGVANLGLDVGF